MVHVILYLLLLAALPSAAYGIALLRSRRPEPIEPSLIDIDQLVDTGDIDVADTTTVTDLRALTLPKAD